MKRPSVLAAFGVVVLATLATLAAAGPVAGQDAPPERLTLRAADARLPEEVTLAVTWSGDADELEDLSVAVDGDEVDTTVTDGADAGLVHDIVFVVDTSASTDLDGALAGAKQILVGDPGETGDGFVGRVPTGTRIGIVAASTAGQTLVRPTADPVALERAVDALGPDGEGGVVSGLILAAGLIARADGVGTVVLLTDGLPGEPDALRADARARLVEAGAVLHVIGLDAEGFDLAPLDGLASATGGSVAVTDDPSELDEGFDDLVPELRQLVVAGFEGDDDPGVRELSVTVGDVTVEGSFVTGADLVGPGRLEPRPVVAADGLGILPAGPDFLRGDTGRTLGIAAVLVAVALLAFGVLLIFIRDDRGLGAALRPYSESYVAAGADEVEETQALAQTALLRRAVEATESFAERQGFLTRVERVLEKADLPLRAGEALFFYAAFVLVVLVAALILTGNPTGTLVVTLFTVLVPPAVVNFLATRKKKQFEALLPDTLQLLSSTLRAGYSMMQGVEAVSQESAEPMGQQLRRVVTESRLGRPLEESLEAVAERMGSSDFGWAVMAVRIQREVGGNLSELLMTVAETMTQRERLRRDIRSLTAEGRISAYVLGGLPIGLGLALYAINPDYMGRLFDSGIGQLGIGASIVAMGAGFAWMAKIIRIDL